MTDITKAIFEGKNDVDPERDDRMHELAGWNKETGEKIAEQENIRMTPAHWDVVHFLRQHYLENGRARSARDLGDALEQAFADQGGRKYLYELFPDGPVAQGCRIARIPAPPYAEDKSFGSSF